VSDHAKCPFCGSELEGFTDPATGEAMAELYFEQMRRACDLADLLEWELEGSSSEIPEVLRAWRLLHPRISRPHPGDNPGEKSPDPEEESV
jgi:hypothetical protein